MADIDAALTGGNYEVLRSRLATGGQELARRADALNVTRKALFGTTEPQLIATERVRTEHNCAPADIVGVGDYLLLGYNVFLGLKSETKISDVLALHRFEPQGDGDGGFDTAALPLEPGGPAGFLCGAELARDFANLYRYYRDARLIQLVKLDTQLLAVFQAGASWRDRKVLRWRVEPDGSLVYVDDRGDRDHAAMFPAAYDFEWIEVTRDHQVSGKHPHYNLLDTLFVECVHGDLTIKVENNTETGQGIYAEPVDDANQSLDDAKIFFAPIGASFAAGSGAGRGGLVLLKILPFRETSWRYLIFDTRSQTVVRADGIAQGCRSLPEDHGVIFPGGYVLVGGAYKTFDGDASDYLLERELRSPNGEDVLYVYHRGSDGTYLLYSYNLIDKAVTTPITCHGYSLFADGRMVVMRAPGEPTRVHPMQVWRTPFTSAEHAASAPTNGSYLAKVGNADLVRGLSDALSVARLAGADQPVRTTFDDILALSTRAIDQYYWLAHPDAGDLKGALADVKATAKLILDEYDKVVALEAEARRVLAEASQLVAERLRATRSEGFASVDLFLDALTGLRALRGELITKAETRFIDKPKLAALEAEVAAAFERVTIDCVAFLAKGNAFGELVARADTLATGVGALATALEVKAVREQIDKVATGVDLLGSVIGALKIDDTTKRTAILENITDAFGRVNRARATIEGRHRELAAKEGRAEFGAQVKLLTQSVASALAQCDTPERCDQELTRLLVQLEELEGRFAEIDELTTELAVKREEIVEAVGARKQLLAAERQRRAANLLKAAQRILEGVTRRAAQLATADEVNAYFAADAMVQKLREIGGELGGLGDGVKADELEARLKAARQEALRGQRDRADLFEGGGELIKFGDHRFAVNAQPLELMIVPHDDGLAVHLTGTDFYEPIDDAQLLAARRLWARDLPSESAEVYRGEYLAASVLADAEAGAPGPTLAQLVDAARAGTLEAVVRTIAQERYDEGYERGVHDTDAARLLERLLAMRDSAGLLAYPAAARALAVMFWGAGAPVAAASPGQALPTVPSSLAGVSVAALAPGGAMSGDAEARLRWQRSAQSLARLADVLGDRGARRALAHEIAPAIVRFVEREALSGLSAGDAELAATYLVHELAAAAPRFVVSGAAVAIVEALHDELAARAARVAFDDDLRALAGDPGDAFALACAWVDGVLARKPELASAALEAAALLATPKLARATSSAVVEVTVTGLLGRHPRIQNGALAVRLDELTARLARFRTVEVPEFRAHRALRNTIGERERRRLRIDELKPHVISSFVRNRLIDQVYLPLIGANLAKQLGAAGANKRTDQMGMLLLISPPGYGKTTLMEYVAARLGLAFVKVNGPALGHKVTSLDPADAPNATARQEIEKVSLALEMGTNVMLYLDDIQHTSPELLQKFISLCDAQRKIEGVWRGRARTYDLRGKKLCVVMAGNPYTESGEQFRIPDMLANRADVYNLGDVLTGKADTFAMSFLENALTSNQTLAPLATRDLGDIYKIFRMARGEPVPTTELSYGYSGGELGEILAVIRHLYAAQETLLRVNQEYIRSAAQADAFRTEPPFKLQGSYRNMNKIAEKVVAAMTPAELQAVVDDHYQGESQTLTTAAEQNLLKLAELRGRLTPAQAARWADIKAEHVRQRRMGGGADDPVTRLVGTLSGLGAELGAIHGALAANPSAAVASELRALRETVGAANPNGEVADELRALRDIVDNADPNAELTEEVRALREAVGTANPTAELTAELRALREAVLRVVSRSSADAASRDPQTWLGPRLDALAESMRHAAASATHAARGGHPGPGSVLDAQLLQQVRRIEQSLVPVVGAAVEQRAGDTLLANKMVQIIELLEQLDARLSMR
jgi:ATPase involved in DNA repair/ATPase family associated with various cellular activities (AAA)